MLPLVAEASKALNHHVETTVAITTGNVVFPKGFSPSQGKKWRFQSCFFPAVRQKYIIHKEELPLYCLLLLAYLFRARNEAQETLSCKQSHLSSLEHHDLLRTLPSGKTTHSSLTDKLPVKH